MTESRIVRVLVVDDDVGMQGLLSAICRRMRYECDTAGDGAEALEKLREQQFDVMLLDLMMPRVNGFDVIDALEGVAERPAIIVVTAAGDRLSGSLSGREAVSAILKKPFELAQLGRVLTSVVESARRHRPTPA